MSDAGNDRAGTIWDWPVIVMLVAVVLLIAGAKVVGGLLLAFGVVALLIRRGAFTPRR